VAWPSGFVSGHAIGEQYQTDRIPERVVGPIIFLGIGKNGEKIRNFVPLRLGGRWVGWVWVVARCIDVRFEARELEIEHQVGFW